MGALELNTFIYMSPNETSGYPMDNGLTVNAPKQNELQRELERIEKTAAELSSVVESLASRLAPISRQQNPSSDGLAKTPECITPIGIALMQIREKIQIQISRIVDTRDRLEV